MSEHFAQADVVFVGELDSNRPTPGATRHRFEVDRVFKGEVGTVTDVLSPGPGGCGLSPDPGQSFVVFATRGGTLWSGREVGPGVLMDVSCAGSRPMGVERAEVLFDTGQAPSADITVPDDSQLALKQPMILAVLVAAVLAGGVAVVLRRRSAA